MEHPLAKIIQLIATMWQKGIVLSQDDLSFFDSSCGLSTYLELKTALHREDDHQQQMILEYAFFPDTRCRMDLEPLLPAEGLTEKEVRKISEKLIESGIAINFFHPDKPDPITVQVPPDQVEVFVSRLYMTRKTDPEISTAFKNFKNDFQILPYKVLLRQKNIQFTQARKQFLVKFIQQSSSRPQEFSQVFDLFLDLLAQAPQSGSIPSFILERHQQEKIMLKQIQKFEEKQERYNMEYLMLSRYPIPTESFEAVAGRLENINIICSILDLPAWMSFEHPVQDLGQFDPEKDLKRLLDTLS